MAILGEDALWMELHTLQVQMLSVTQPHHHAPLQPGGDLQATRKAFTISDQRVIARGRKRLGQTSEHAFSLVMHR